MSCSFPYLDELGYEDACGIHDDDYLIGTTVLDKIKSDLKFSKNITYVDKWYSPFIAIASFAVLTIWPGAYYRALK